jgi:hypothetical protein
MKTNPLPKIFSLLAVALFAAGLTMTASAAGPMTYLPVKSAQEAGELKVGSQIAFGCDKCHGITIATVDSKRAYLTSFKCPLCKQTFVPHMSAGRQGAIGTFTYTDKSGHTAFLAAAH